MTRGLGLFGLERRLLGHLPGLSHLRGGPLDPRLELGAVGDDLGGLITETLVGGPGFGYRLFDLDLWVHRRLCHPPEELLDVSPDSLEHGLPSFRWMPEA